jgi:hypothetical protein
VAGVADPGSVRDHGPAAVSDTRLQRDIVHSRPLALFEGSSLPILLLILLLDALVSITTTRTKDEDDLVAVPEQDERGSFSYPCYLRIELMGTARYKVKSRRVATSESGKERVSNPWLKKC